LSRFALSVLRGVRIMSEKEYTSLERVLTALEHKEPDRIPLDLGGPCVTGISKITYKALREHFGLPETEIRIHDKAFQTAVVEDDMVEKLRLDVQSLTPEPPEANEVSEEDHIEGNYTVFTDVNGFKWRMPLKDGHYYDNLNHPLAFAEEISDLDKYNWFDYRNDKKMYVNMKEQAERIKVGNKRASTINYPGSGIFENACNLIGYEEFYCRMITDKPFIHALMKRCMEQKMGFWEACLDQAGENAIICSENDDLGTQRSPFFSNELYKEMIFPYHKEFFNFMKQKAKGKVYVMLHSCGAIKPLIPLLIEAGVDILNPVQVNAEGMDTKELKKEFGNDITFWGGGIDTQKILPYGTEQEVRDEVKRRIDDLAPGGGFVFTQIHNIVSNVPLKNVLAMYESFYDNCRY